MPSLSMLILLTIGKIILPMESEIVKRIGNDQIKATVTIQDGIGGLYLLFWLLCHRAELISLLTPSTARASPAK